MMMSAVSVLSFFIDLIPPSQGILSPRPNTC
jgi:hypothetical protein